MKITIVAFDLWGFNQKIVDHLKSKGAEVTFIDSSKLTYVYKNKWQRFTNFLSKIILKKNIKKEYRDRVLFEKTNHLPEQDIVLIVNPSHFNNRIINTLKEKTNKFIAYNYDSLARNPLPENYLNLFETIYSFDVEDLKNNTYLKPLTNFNYLEKNINNNISTKAFIVLLGSLKREKLLKKIADSLDKQQIKNYEFIVVEPELTTTNKNIQLSQQTIPLKIIEEKMKNTEILVDLIRENQSGLSFRFFEAMALHKKIITNNKSVMDYDFYNQNNILVIDNDFTEIPTSFLSGQYKKISESIYEKYTLNTWAKTVFGI